MTAKLYAHVDDEGKISLPQNLIETWGLSAEAKLSISTDGSRIQLRPPVTSLRRVYIEITNQCNLNCSTCMRNVWEVEYGRMDMADFEGILAELHGRSSKPEIFIGGYGEPLSHPDCLKMILKAKSMGFRVLLITNGILLTEEVSRAFIEIGLDMLWVSLDGASPECYADIRLGNALPQILENLNRLRSLQFHYYGFFPWTMLPKLGIAFVAMKRNIQDLPKIIRLGTKLGAVEYSISNVLAHNQQLKDENLYRLSLDFMNSPDANQWRPLVHFPKVDLDNVTEKLIVELLKNGNRLDLMGSELRMNGDQCPFVERGSLSIRWDGKVSPCLPLMYSHKYFLGERERTVREYFVGNIHDQDLVGIWNNPSYQAMRERLQDFDYSPCTTCNSCEMADTNEEDCFGNTHPTCGGCLWAQGFIRCP